VAAAHASVDLANEMPPTRASASDAALHTARASPTCRWPKSVREVAGDDPEPALVELLAGIERGPIAARLIWARSAPNPLGGADAARPARVRRRLLEWRSDSAAPTIQAVLAARIDRLEPRERAVLQRASVEGRLFHRGDKSAEMR
jgi:hypothetical protein